jgi:hypothetical protein
VRASIEDVHDNRVKQRANRLDASCTTSASGRPDNSP